VCVCGGGGSGRELVWHMGRLEVSSATLGRKPYNTHSTPICRLYIAQAPKLLVLVY